MQRVRKNALKKTEGLRESESVGDLCGTNAESRERARAIGTGSTQPGTPQRGTRWPTRGSTATMNDAFGWTWDAEATTLGHLEANTTVYVRETSAASAKNCG
jgi:hypothetical protein